ncbi:DNA ligase [Campylobacter sp. RM3125]|uniref:DNA ligase n=1 Tax=Campylobacter molothri TaxID=1032242 RepID=UPI00301D3A0B|nr:DNA ligase [Campylobacter sp. RM3125]MBZ7972174.1 DNA ligase [Campylobacter sp. RM3124]
MKIFFLFCFYSLSFADEILLLTQFNKQDFQNKNLHEYVMSEKLDGVRGIWNGKTLKTRKDQIITPPSFFMKNFPSFALDGELWMDRNNFDSISSLIRTTHIDINLWKKVSYNVFDVPNACEEFNLNPCSLENRLQVLEKYLQENSNPYIKIIPQIPIKNEKHLNDFYENIVKNKGEGVVIRKNLGSYERGRSKQALKLKPYNDAECQVIGYTKGKGKFENQIGALICKTTDNKIIKIGSGLKDKDRKNPPSIGAIITYKFSGFTKNSLPRFPVFLRIRE